MSVWPNLTGAPEPLTGAEGSLTCISVEVDSRRLESLLDTLAGLPFPINPQIYHDAAVAYRFADGSERITDRTLVEFPAYAQQTGDVRHALEGAGFGAFDLHVTRMLDEISGPVYEPAPDGAPFVSRLRIKRKLPTAPH
jgi:hypothetical protein